MQNGYGDFVERFKQIIAENQSLTLRLDDCRQALRAKDEEISMLNRMLAEAGATQSIMDSKMDEMQHMQDSMSEIQKLMEHVSLDQTGITVPAVQNDETAAELGELKELNAYHQVQLKDLKEQVKELKARNALLEQSAGRVAELESSLAIITEERDQWKNFVMNKG
ncbi:MAG: hypothetical protein QM791_20000 [Ferruginibacter sp.]